MRRPNPPSPSRPRCRRAGLALRALATAPLAALLAVPFAAASVTIDDVLPLYFDATSGQGLAPGEVASSGLVPGFAAGPDDDWISAGEGDWPVRITRSFGPVHQEPATPTFEDPVIADSLWRIENASAGDLRAPLLVFVSVDPLGSYPIAPPPLALDGHLIDLLVYTDASDPNDVVEFVYGVVPLPDLPQGGVSEVTVRYIAAGELADGSPQPLPPLGVLVLGSYVPEPSTGLLVASGLAALAGIARRRSRP